MVRHRVARPTARVLAVAALVAALLAGTAAAAAGGPPMPRLREVHPADGAAPVPPDAEVRIAFDPDVPGWGRYAQALRRGHYRLTLNGQDLAAAYDPEAATLRARPALQRYTAYRVELVVPVPPARSPQPPPVPQYRLSFAFATGSARHEPARVEVTAGPAVAVPGPAVVRVAARDDYGAPAAGTVRVTLAESGRRRPGSARAEPGDARLDPAGGEVTVQVTDPEAEEVVATVEVAGSYPDARDDHRHAVSLTFRSGPPASLSLEANPSEVDLAAASVPVRLAGVVTDAYGNPVAHEVTVRVTGTASGAHAPRAARSDGETGAFAVELTVATPEFLHARAQAGAGGPEAALARPVRVRRPLEGGTGRELGVRVGAPPVPGAPHAVSGTLTGPPGSGEGAYVQVWRAGALLAGAPVAADGSFAVAGAWVDGDLLTLRFLASPPPARYERRVLSLPLQDWVGIAQSQAGEERTYLEPKPLWAGTRTGYDATGRRIGWRERGLLRFDLRQLPPGTRVRAARLVAYTGPGATWWDRGGYLTVVPLAGPWDGQVTWSTQPPPGDGAVTAPLTATECTPHRTVWDLTAVVQEWVDGRRPNHGLLLHAGPPGRPETPDGLRYGLAFAWKTLGFCGHYEAPVLQLEVDVPQP